MLGISQSEDARTEGNESPPSRRTERHSDDRTQCGNTDTSLEGKSLNHNVTVFMYYNSGLPLGPIYYVSFLQHCALSDYISSLLPEIYLNA